MTGDSFALCRPVSPDFLGELLKTLLVRSCFLNRFLYDLLEVSKIRGSTLLKLLVVLYRTSECFEPEHQRAHDIRAGK